MEDRKEVIKKLISDKKHYKKCTFGGEDFAMRIPTTRELIRMESNNATMEGQVDLAGYIGDICGLLMPVRTLEDMADIKPTIDISVGNKTIILENVTASKALTIINNSSKIERDKDDPKKIILRPNTEEMMDAILSLSKEKIDIDELKLKEIKLISEKFESELNIDVLMEVYTFFQKNIQA